MVAEAMNLIYLLFLSCCMMREKSDQRRQQAGSESDWGTSARSWTVFTDGSLCHPTAARPPLPECPSSLSLSPTPAALPAPVVPHDPLAPLLAVIPLLRSGVPHVPRPIALSTRSARLASRSSNETNHPTPVSSHLHPGACRFNTIGTCIWPSTASLVVSRSFELSCPSRPSEQRPSRPSSMSPLIVSRTSHITSVRRD